MFLKLNQIRCITNLHARHQGCGLAVEGDPSPRLHLDTDHLPLVLLVLLQLCQEVLLVSHRDASCRHHGGVQPCQDLLGKETLFVTIK